MTDAPDPSADKPENEADNVETPAVITPALIAEIVGAVGDRDVHSVRRTIEDLHPADAADLLEQLPTDVFRGAIELLDHHLPGETVTELADDVRAEALDILSDSGIATITEKLDSDDASFILNDLDEDRRADILAKVSATDRAAIETSLSFDEESAGRLMQRDFVAAPVFWTVGQTIDHLRSVDEDDLPDTFFDIYAVDPGFRLQGSVSLSTILRSSRETTLQELMHETAVSIRPEMDQEAVAYVFQQYNLASAPVVDEAGRLTGMITVDDMVDVIQEENREDLLALSGVSEAGVNQSVYSAVKARLPWLAATLVAAFLASTVVALFEATIDQVVALAILMPVIAGLCGNAGSQSLAVAVRAIAERDLEGPLVARAVRREIFTALANGAIIALLSGVVTWLWFGDAMLGVVIAAALLFTFIWAGFVGIMAPLMLKRMGVDPAVASGVFVLTSIDLMGFFVFLGLATIILL